MNKDSLIYLSVPRDTLSTQIQQINNQLTTTDKTVGSGLVGLWIIGLIITVFIFKRPNK